jgi:hypothetical protein
MSEKRPIVVVISVSGGCNRLPEKRLTGSIPGRIFNPKFWYTFGDAASSSSLVNW